MAVFTAIKVDSMLWEGNFFILMKRRSEAEVDIKWGMGAGEGGGGAI